MLEHQHQPYFLPCSPYFITEKQIEAQLEMETRDLPMPDGAMRKLTMFKVFWNAVDSLILNGWDWKLNRWGWSRGRLVEEALSVSEANGWNFQYSFERVVNFVMANSFYAQN